MAANIQPIFTLTGNFSSVRITAANTSSEGGGTIGTDIFLAFTAGANGSYVESVQFMPTATAPTTTTATVGRVFVSSKSSGATANTDTFLYQEVPLPASAADNTASAVNPITIPLNFVLKSGQTLLVTNHAAPAANSEWRANVVAADY